MAHAYVAPPTSDRTPRLRARRISVDLENLGVVRAELTHAERGRFTGEVRDLSLHGIGVELEAGANPVLFAADRLETIELQSNGQVLFRGRGTIRRISDEGEKLKLGIELDGDGIDLAEVYRQGTRQSFAQRLAAFERSTTPYSHLNPDFKAWVADFRSRLDSLKGFLGNEERALATEDLFTRSESERQILEHIRPWIVREMESARTHLNEIVCSFSDDDHEVHRNFLKLHVSPLFAESPFMRRAYEKPLGYAGDYEMMNMLYRNHAEGDSLFGKAINLYATNEEAAVAVVERVSYLKNLVRKAIESSNRERVRIASIGCGPAREIALLLQESPSLGERLEVALIDQEERSISYCERTLTPFVSSTGARFQFVRESVRDLMTKRALRTALGERELIYSAGLFDYLSDRAFDALLSVLYGALAPGGSVAVGNFATHNPSRLTMEYFSEWFLIHRTSEEMMRFGKRLEPSPSNVAVEAEPTGINLFLIVKR